ncbi:MAG: hypothetical protein IKW76_04095 [Clostridia bacterium]|nr:hypothetical protein [Clostridia bacterium]
MGSAFIAHACPPIPPQKIRYLHRNRKQGTAMMIPSADTLCAQNHVHFFGARACGKAASRTKEDIIYPILFSPHSFFYDHFSALCGANPAAEDSFGRILVGIFADDRREIVRQFVRTAASLGALASLCVSSCSSILHLLPPAAQNT